jgi:acyl-CoA synthetase (AMP-forming)/AMP-acid ligase II
MRLHSEALITEFTDQGHWGEQTVLGILDATVARLGDAIALEDPPDREELVGSAGRTLTWREFGTAVDGIAAGLHARGVGKDDVVVVQLPNVWELPALYFAIARTGAVIAPMPVQWRERELRHIVGLTEAVLYIGVDELKGTALMPYADAALPGTVQQLELRDVAALAATPAPPTIAYPTVDANDVFTLCWTSGTEAQPKGCPLSHNNWIFQGQSFRRATNLRDNCRILGPAPIVNMTGVGIMLMWLLSGGRLMLHQPLNLPALLRQIPDADFTMLVPAILTMLLKLPEAQQPDFSTVEAIATGSAPPSPWAIEEFRRRWGVEVVNVFGQNEGTILAAGAADVPDSVMRSSHFPWWGKPAAAWASGVDGIDVKLLADDGSVCTEVGDVGELAYRGPNVFPGYFKADELNLEAFTAEGHVRTGDLFKILDDRHIGFVDRKKDIIIRGGFNVSAAEVETVAQGHPGIADAAAVSAPDEVLGERVCLFVVPQDSSTPPSLEDVVTFMRGEGIAIYKLPERLEIIAEIPRNPVGKILKKDLRTRLRAVTPA